MAAAKHPLRKLVAKWLGATSAGPMRILLMRRSRTGGTCCLHIQAQRSADTVTLLFSGMKITTGRCFRREPLSRPCGSAASLSEGV